MTSEKSPVSGIFWSGTLVFNEKGRIVDIADYKEYSLKERQKRINISNTSS